MRILITGAGGTLGGALIRACRDAGHEPIAMVRAGSIEGVESVACDLESIATKPEGVPRVAVDSIIHAAAMPAPDMCEDNRDLAHRINVEAARSVADAAHARDLRCVFVSTDHVFEGFSGGSGPDGLYRESDPTGPVNYYAQTKLQAEGFVSQAGGVIARMALVTSGLDGAWFGDCAAISAREHQILQTKPPPVRTATSAVLSALKEGRELTLFTDEIRTPVDAAFAARCMVMLATMPSPPSVVHVAGPRRLSRYDIGMEIARNAGLEEQARHLIKPGLQAKTPTRVKRPRDCSFDTSLLKSLIDSI